MKRTLWMVAAMMALASAGPGFGAEIRERTSYFTLHGSTLAELDRELARKGPQTSKGDIRHPGATEVKFSGRVTYQPTGKSCRVAKVNFMLRLVKILPKWTPPRSASKTTVVVWTTLSDDIARHEGDHAKIAKMWLKKMESAVRNLGPERTCEAMEARVNAVGANYLAGHEAAQRQFDVVEGREMNRRLTRLLKRNVAEATARK